ncbi:MAG: hypothetical protein JWQ09_1405 [Segetibacter sp.]|nr:hypothetical protein [Segetibacter sp.]
MNFIQGLLGKAFPPYRHSLLRQEQGQIVSAIINALPSGFSDLKEQIADTRNISLNSWTLFPEYKFVSGSFPGERIFKYKKNGINYKISGIEVFSKLQQKYVEAEILINNNLIAGLKISNAVYELADLDTSYIVGRNANKSVFDFPKSELDKFVDSLDVDIKNRLNLHGLFEIDFDNQTFFTFYDLEDGNYLAVDKKKTVYSLVHGSKPMAKKMKTTLLQILTDIQNGKFDKQRHLDERYAGSK